MVVKKQVIYRSANTAKIVEGLLDQSEAAGLMGPSPQCIRAGNHVYITGQTGLTLEGELRHPYDAAAQTRLACENIKTLIEMAGGTMNDIVRYVCYTTDRAYRAQVYPIFRSYFDLPPCGTGLIVDGLARPELVVEIDCWGFIDDPD